MEEEIGRFEAQADDGTIYIVLEIQELRQFQPLDGPSQLIKGMKRLELIDGKHVNYIDPNTFKIVSTEEIIRKIA